MYMRVCHPLLVESSELYKSQPAGSATACRRSGGREDEEKRRESGRERGDRRRR